jgi:hypothetical protein
MNFWDATLEFSLISGQPQSSGLVTKIGFSPIGHKALDKSFGSCLHSSDQIQDSVPIPEP